MAHDEEVNKALNFLGWHVIRFWGKEIKKDPDSCVQAIKELIFDISIQNSEDQ